MLCCQFGECLWERLIKAEAFILRCLLLAEMHTKSAQAEVTWHGMVLSIFTLQKYLFVWFCPHLHYRSICMVLSMFALQKYLFVQFYPHLHDRSTCLYCSVHVYTTKIPVCIVVLWYAFVWWFNAYLCYKSMLLFSGSMHIYATKVCVCSVVQCIFVLHVRWFNAYLCYKSMRLYGGSIAYLYDKSTVCMVVLSILMLLKYLFASRVKPFWLTLGQWRAEREIGSWCSSNNTHQPHMPALFFVSQTQTARHKVAVYKHHF